MIWGVGGVDVGNYGRVEMEGCDQGFPCAINSMTVASATDRHKVCE